MKFTIVIPCYKCEAWVKGCIDSVKAQSGDWECIIRVEPSSDNTVAVVRREVSDERGLDGEGRSLADPRFVLLEGDCPSGGPSLSRNIGIERATGDYVLFLDCDDALAPESLTQLEPFLASHPDVATMAINWDGNIRDTWEGIEGPLSGTEATIRLAEKQAFPLAMAQQYICRTQFLREKRLQFVSGVYHEDEEFFPRLLYLADSVLPTHLPLYLYCIRQESMTTASQARNVVAIAKVMKCHLDFWRDAQPAEAVTRAWTRTWLSMFFYVFFHPKASANTPAEKTRQALKELFCGDEAQLLRDFASYASKPKRLGLAMARFSAITGILWPTRIFFALYYSLCERGIRKGDCVCK